MPGPRDGPGRGARATLVVIVLGAAAAALAVDAIRARSLAFLRAHGGIAVGVPVRIEGRWQLPLTCDVSGVSSLHQPGNVLHAGLAWWRSVAVVEDDRIYLSIETRVMGPDAGSARCGPADLGSLPEREYTVLYRDPDGTASQLGVVRVGNGD